MTFAKVKNPTDKEITLDYKGKKMVIEAKGTETFELDCAKQWVRIFQFMTMEPVSDTQSITNKKEAEEEVKEEANEETKEEVEGEVVVEEPKKVAKKTAKKVTTKTK